MSSGTGGIESAENYPSPAKRTVRLDDVSNFKMPGEWVYEGVTFSFAMTNKSLKDTRNMETEKDDCFVASYPKTGTTLTQEIMWLIINNVDFDKANSEANYKRAPYLEYEDEGYHGVDTARQLSSPRLCKTHLPWHLAPKAITERDNKTVYVMRNPKDTLVSYYYFYCSTVTFGFFKGTWNDFFELFLQDRLYCGNIFDHFLGWWEHRKAENILIIKYEDIIRDHHGQIEKIASFLGKKLSSTQIDSIQMATTFKVMQKNKMTNFSDMPEAIDQSVSPFYRKGTVGDWMNHFTVAQNMLMDQIIEKRLSGSGLTFDYSI